MKARENARKREESIILIKISKKIVDEDPFTWYYIRAVKNELTKNWRLCFMSTYMPKAGDISRDWYVLDADGRTLGDVATEAATLLRGKHKPTFAPHADCGDNVIVINAEKIVFTGNKLEQKKYYRHTGYIGHLKEVSYKTLMAEKPEFAVEKAVKGMLSNNSLSKKAMTRLHIYKGAEHPHAAQKPQAREF